MSIAHARRRGFSLLELSVVLVIVALLMGGSIVMGSNAVKAAQRVTTQERLATIQEALEAYRRTNGYLPCPVDRAQSPTGNPTTFGREIRPCAASGAGLVRVASNTVDIGGVPVRTVNKVKDGRPHIVDMVKAGEIQLVFTTVDETRTAIADSRHIRTAALANRVSYYTTMAGCEAATEALKHQADVSKGLSVVSLQEMHAQLL